MEGLLDNLVGKNALVKEIHKGGRKRRLAWAYSTPFGTVHWENGEEAEEEYLQAILLCYASVDGCCASGKAALLAQGLHKEELAAYMEELFDKWMEAGAEVKKRWTLYAVSIHGGPKMVKKLQEWIWEWPQQGRGALAAEAVQALALSPQPQALVIVDGISRRFPYRQVKKAAGKALDLAAGKLGVCREELEDRIVPDFGFDRKGERYFTYGERQFKALFTPSLGLEVYDRTGKRLKNMPVPGERDDAAQAQAAYEAFRQMKKQIKAIVKIQKMRLELALSCGRKWNVGAWKRLFTENPVMRQFAIGLVWGIYDEKGLAQGFRYMEDGSLHKQEEEEYSLPEDGKVGLVHPMELSAEQLEAWKRQLEGYEARQPIEQLGRKVYTVTGKEADAPQLERFGGYIVNDLVLGGKLQEFGWRKGPVKENGCYNSYYRTDEEAGVGVKLFFSGSCVGGENEDVTVHYAKFYPADRIKDGFILCREEKETPVSADRAADFGALLLKEVPGRYFSEIALQLAKATASSRERDEGWKDGI